MKKSLKLTISMAIFFLIVFVAFGVIIVTEKSSTLFIPKIEDKLNTYLKETYPELKDKVKSNTPTYNATIYKMKVENINNKNLYFYITYSNKKIKDTYKEDYIKGNTFIKHIERIIKKTIKDKTNKQPNIKINQTLDNCSTKVKDYLLKEKNLEQLSIYTLEDELSIKKWTSKDLYTAISNYNLKIKEANIIPKSYTFTINDTNDITKSVIISNITPELIETSDLTLALNDIIENKKTNISKYNITYKYMN